MEARYTIPKINEIVDDLNQAFNRGRKKSDKTREFASQYGADLIYESIWKPILVKMESKI
jgi:type IV secretory pathway VirD2 relaxase